jgi:transcriptional regulator with XRE-family HTH domain
MQEKNNSYRKYFLLYSGMKGEPMTEPYNIAPRVQRAFEQSGMTKAQIAQRAEIRWAQLHKILTGQRPQVSADTVRRLAQALDVSSDYLLGLTDDPAPRKPPASTPQALAGSG